MSIFSIFSRSKVFCVGRNKTGTTSVAEVLRQFGYAVGNQNKAEALMGDWAQRDFRRIIHYCRFADAYQDVPFSLPYTYQAVDSAFPGSKFILTVRCSAGEWYDSLTRFHSGLMGKGRLPTPDDLKEYPYAGRGWLWRQQTLVYDVDETTLYDRQIYTQHYDQHNAQVVDYFRHRPGDLLVVNLADGDAMERLCHFLGKPYTGQTMPHLNQSK
jgi:hypothetical protein